jgi:SAM-dependent methyltransferase
MIKPRWFSRSPNFTPDAVVTALYRGVLQREPDEAGFSQAVAHIRNGVPLNCMVAEFLKSPEYLCNTAGVVSTDHFDFLPANEFQLDLSAEERRRLWQHVGGVWSRLGSSDPYWSVLASDEHAISKMSPDRINDFYESGRHCFDRLMGYLARHGLELAHDASIIDYGCGLGRATLWLARHCRRVIAVDVSEPHIALAEENLSSRGVTNVDFHLVRGAADLDILNGFDLFHSVIVLQHNPPPLIVEILRRVFSGMNPGGHAFFQVPTYWIGYRWDLDGYLAETAPRQEMEMHVLPQTVVFELAAQAGCVPLEVEPDSCTGLPNGISNTFLFAKPA